VLSQSWVKCNPTRRVQYITCSGGNHIVQCSCWADFTIPGQNWWPNNWRDYFTSARWEWGRKLSWHSLCVGGVAHPQSSKNKTLHHLAETGSELKLTDFQEKSNQPKCSVLAPRLALQAVEDGDCYHTSSSQDHIREPAYTRLPIPPRKVWAQTSSLDPPQSCMTGRSNIHCHTALHNNLKKGHRHRERPCQNCQHLDLISEERVQNIHWTDFFI
jgi:hypothetical protein